MDFADPSKVGFPPVRSNIVTYILMRGDIIFTLFFISNIFMSDTRLKLAKKLSKS